MFRKNVMTLRGTKARNAFWLQFAGLPAIVQMESRRKMAIAAKHPVAKMVPTFPTTIPGCLHLDGNGVRCAMPCSQKASNGWLCFTHQQELFPNRAGKNAWMPSQNDGAVIAAYEAVAIAAGSGIRLNIRGKLMGSDPTKWSEEEED